MVGSMRTSPRRLWEIDALRGLAVVAMIFFHFMWDLWFLGLTSENIPGSGWQTFARSIGMVDYYPLVPWLGVALLGIVAGRTAYADGQRHFELPDLSASQPITWLCTLGRNSLVVYLAHQPLLIGALLGGRALGLW